ncbi:ABC transporter ATP-binding protein [Salipiger thiooxidans]|nr:ABC transporter ATP-binding protein [Salipiger thiooxidans]
MTMDAPFIEVEDLTLSIGAGGRTVVDEVSYSIQPGEIVALVGESGSGKTLAARALLKLIPPGIRQTGGCIRIGQRDLGGMSPREMRRLRGGAIGMVFQEPMTSLNPSLTIGRQLEEALELHTDLDRPARRAALLSMLERVGLSDPEQVLRAWPHEFSGGMRQRIMLASVMLTKPRLLIADEPTTALDAVVQRDVLELMVSLTAESETAVLLISHDLAMVAQYSQRTIVMCRGKIVEQGPTAGLLRAPKDPYTKQLLAAMPRRESVPEADLTGPPLAEVRNLVVDFHARAGFLKARPIKRALHGIDLKIWSGEVVGVVGGSGSGKTTMGRVITGLQKATRGEVVLRDGAGVQMIFQDPYSSLDPRMTVAQCVDEALRHSGMERSERRGRVADILAEVGLAGDLGQRYPHELSGGQRQRVAIARAIVCEPKLVVADEPVSALDTTVRAQVLKLFAALQRRHGFACIFISHDLSVVEQIANRVIVMKQGRVVEEGSRDAIFDQPRAPYTLELLRAIPVLEMTPEGGVSLRRRQDATPPAH